MRPIGAVALLAIWTGVAAAHGRSLSYSRWELGDGGAHVEVRIPMLELTRLIPDESPGAYLAAKLRLLAADDPC
ncbi:MAG TPA: hypothetical protein VGJ70_25925, partial [Solirubrobacteraceae bacterium]